MSVKLSELSEPLLLADKDPMDPKDARDPRLDPEEADNVLRDKLKQDENVCERRG